MGVNYALQRIFGLFTHAAHIRSVLKCSYQADCLGSSQPELPAPFGDFVVNTVYRLLLSITGQVFVFFHFFGSFKKRTHLYKFYEDSPAVCRHETQLEEGLRS